MCLCSCTPTTALQIVTNLVYPDLQESIAHLNEGFWDGTRLKRASSARCIHSPLAQTAQTASR